MFGMVTVKDIFGNLNELAPTETKLGFDNVGLLAGDMNAAVTKVVLALDVTDAVIDEARAAGAELIVAHHPMFFSLDRVNMESGNGRRMMKLISAGISEISMHTNLDAAPGGVNDALAAALGLAGVISLCGPEKGGREESLPRIGRLPEEVPLAGWLPELKKRLSAPGLRYYDAGLPVNRVGVIGGSGGDELELLKNAGCDTVVTADVKYHVFQQARDLGVNIVDAGHFETETVVLPVLQKRLSAAFTGITFTIAESNKPIIMYA